MKLLRLLKINLPIFCALTLLPAYSAASVALPGDIHTSAMASIEAIYREDFKSAEDEARKIMRAHPDHPAGYFFMAAAIDAWMLRYQSSRREAEFFRFCDQAIEKAERVLAKDPNNEWARFFLGGADGYKGTYEARYDRYVTSFRYGWKGVSVFIKMEAAGSKLADLDFGIGCYDYWRSALTKMLWWMPGVADKRAVGIDRLKRAANNGLYTRIPSAQALVAIYLNEKRNKEALSLANAMMKKYPNATIFQWGYAEASHKVGNHDDAIRVYNALLAKVEKDPNSNFYNSIQARIGLARALVAKGQNAEARGHLDAIGQYQLSKDIRKRLDSVFSEVNSLRKKTS